MHNERLLKQATKGDITAIEALITQYYPEILRYCRYHLPNQSFAEDAAQETFLKAIKYLASCTFSGNFRAFLYTVASNTCIDIARNKWNGIRNFDDVTQDLSVDEPWDAIHNWFTVRQAMQKLTTEEQEIILLRFGQELKLREIAQITKIPMRTVQSKLRKALKILKVELEEGADHE